MSTGNDEKRPRLAATIGTFDGVHRGHATVVGALRREADRRGLAPVAITFDRHPLCTIAPRRVPKMLTTHEVRDALLMNLGVRPLTVKFTEEVRRQTVMEWMQRMHDRIGVDLIMVGYDNTFGSDGLSMSVADYAAIGKTLGITVVAAPELPGISSSAIRRAVAEGRVGDAGRMLGRPYALEGTVVHGQGLGHKLGFATANVYVSEEMAIPGRGVYAAKGVTDDGSQYDAMVNIGLRPTAGVFETPTIEAHLTDFDGDLYGRTLRLEFHTRLRDEKRFASLADLRAQLAEDEVNARAALAR